MKLAAAPPSFDGSPTCLVIISKDKASELCNFCERTER